MTKFRIGQFVVLAEGTNTWAQHQGLKNKVGVVTHHVDDGTPMDRVTVSFAGSPVFQGMHSSQFEEAPHADALNAARDYLQDKADRSQAFGITHISAHRANTSGSPPMVFSPAASQAIESYFDSLDHLIRVGIGGKVWRFDH
ncbi:hypothetical protein ACC717_04290 [Rhizobium ruizarguesonis]